MTDDAFFPEASPDDVLVSADLDGEADAVGSARVEEDPELVQRALELAEARAWVATPVPVPATAREAAVVAALRVFDDEVAGSTRSTARAAESASEGSDQAAASVTSLTDRRKPRAPQLLAAAAAVVVVLFGLGAVLASQRGAEEATTTAASPTNENQLSDATTGAGAVNDAAKSAGDQSHASTDAEGSTSASEGPVTTVATRPSPTASPNAPETSSGAGITDADAVAVVNYAGGLGVLGSPADLRAAVNRAIAREGDPSTSGTPPADDQSPAPPQASVDAARTVGTCATQLAAEDDEIGDVIFSASATYQGTPAVVIAFAIDLDLHPAANGPARIYVVEPTTCRVLDTQTA